MGDYRCSNGSVTSHDDGVLSVVPSREGDIRVVFQKVDGDASDDDEHFTDRLHPPNQIQNNDRDEDDSEMAPDRRCVNGSPPKRGCPLLCCGKDDVDDNSTGGSGNPDRKVEDKKAPCPGLGLLYALLASVFFSIVALLVKKIEGVHAVEISAIRCFFQMVFVIPLMIYYNTGFLGPRDMRIYLILRGFLGSSAMILLFYSVQQMPLADATVIMFSNPVFTAILAWIFLKERCTVWDVVFTAFTLTGVVLIARPPFLFGERVAGLEGDYHNHIKGTIAAFAGAVGAACTMVILRKMGKSVHYYLSVWYYAVIGLAECVIALFVLGEWSLPACGVDRWLMMLIAVLGMAGQTFLTKALQVEKAGPVALMRTTDVVLAFIFQFLFLNRKPTWWSLGGALCVVSSTSGVALRKWISSSRKT
ncbi:solute carrier family 35 member G1 [Alosa sapidissima]|uniref:solute carrier family 35 member G1 n=1 Tax=Alosa sapidissima TaxID=34773 RepID=UPI001C08F2F5|nr:solute carrier family 35 member G1 [Alosa sapidissima]